MNKRFVLTFIPINTKYASIYIMIGLIEVAIGNRRKKIEMRREV
jgi:hypothetical protein